MGRSHMLMKLGGDLLEFDS